MHAVGERITHHKQPRQPMRQRIDHCDFEAEAAIFDQERKGVALAQQALGPLGEPMQLGEQRRRRLLLAERFHADVRGGKGVERNVNPV